MATRSRSLKKFLDPKEIETAIDEVVLAAGKDIPIALAGGVAMQTIGSDRLTTDVDFLSTDIPDGFTVEKPLSFGGASTKSPSGLPVDFIIRDDDYAELYEEALRRAEYDADIGARVVPGPFLIAMKLAAKRPKDEQDIMKVIEENGVDIEDTRHIIHQFLGPYAVDDFNSFVEEVEWQKAKEDRRR